jgi:hypothetical protein
MAAPVQHIPADGTRYGRWTVLGGVRKASSSPKAAKQILCRCDCGTKRYVIISKLRDGGSTSCGCKSKEMHTRMLQRYAPLPKSFSA